MSDTSDVIAGAKQLGEFAKTGRQIAGEYDPDKSNWGRQAIEKSAVELAQLLPSRSNYRASDKPIDTMAGYVLNVDAGVHALITESAATYGDTDAVSAIKAKADAGNRRAQLFLQHLVGGGVVATAPRTVSPAVARSVVGLTDRLPTSVSDFFTPARRGTVHWIVTTVLAFLAVTVTQVSADSWATWTPLIVGVVLAGFDLGVSIFHSTSTLRTAVYGVILAFQPIALLLHWITDAQWTAIAPLLAAVLGGALAAAKTQKW